MMDILLQLFVPEIDSERWQWLWNIYNLCWVLFATGILYVVFLRARKDKTISLIPASWRSAKHILALGMSIGTEVLLIGLSEFLRNPDLSFPFYEPLYSLTSFADKFLYIESIFVAPFSKLPWANIAVRAVGASGVLFLGKRFFQISGELTEAFYKYLQKQINDQNTSKFVQKLWKFLQKFGLIGVTATTSVVIFATKEYREEITSILEWLYSFLEDVTLLSHLPKNASTFPEMAYAFFVMIFSILITAAYLLLIIAVCSVANLLWVHREDLAKKLKKWFCEIGYILLIIAAVILVVLFSVLFATKSASFQEAVTIFVENSPRTIFVFLQHTVLILVAVGVIALMACTLFAVIAFGISFVKSWSKQIEVTNDEEAKRFLKIFGAAFLATIVLACFVFGYDSIRGWLVERFAEAPDGHGLWWVAFQICAALIVMIVAVGAILLSLYLILWMGMLFYKEAKRVLDGRNDIRAATQNKAPLIARIGEYLQSLGETIFRIFAGYRTESEKNNAVYVAACFASLASLINTAMGLHDFNIPLILAVAMSFAVQLAMLVFGMKAGQGIAENIVSDVKQVGANVAIAIVRRLAACFCYFLAFLASAYGICIAFRVENPDLSWIALFNLGDNFLPVLLIWCSLLTFGYAGIKQLIELIILFVKWCKQRKGIKNKGRSSTQKNTSADDSGLLLANPRKIPARFFLMAYILLMIVSTGFAFTNLFGGYANQVQLHTRVYDQIYSETEKTLELQSQAGNIVKCYHNQKQALLNSLQQKYDMLAKANEQNIGMLQEAEALEGTQGREYWYASLDLQYYSAEMVDFGAFYESFVSFINREYDSLGKDLAITVYEYTHFNKAGIRELYSTTAIQIESELLGTPLVIGRINPNQSQEGSERISDIDNADQEVSVKVRTIFQANKYTLLDELLSVFDSYSKKISEYEVARYSYIDYSDSELFDNGDDNVPDDSEKTDKQENLNEADLSNVTKSLDMMEVLDDVRRNIAELYFEAYPETDQNVSMIDLPRVIDLYLLQEDAVEAEQSVGLDASAETIEPVEETTTPTENTAGAEGEASNPTQESEGESEEPTVPVADDREEDTAVESNATKGSYDKHEEYQQLSDYVDRSLQVYNILNVAEVVLEEEPDDKTQDAGSEETTVEEQNGAAGSVETSVEEQNNSAGSEDAISVPDVDGTNVDKAYTIRKYRSYARGVASSNFQISFDALFRGELGLNDTDGRIDALYSAQYVSVFILIICLLVDFMAFFAGLLIFQDAFVLDMKKGSKLEKLGYVNFDAVMTDYFMPTDVEGKTRWHQIALIYYLLHCRSKGTLDLQLIRMMKVEYHDFVVMIHRTKAFLDAYGIAADSADFHVWLNSFVKKKGIDFDAVLK